MHATPSPDRQASFPPVPPRTEAGSRAHALVRTVAIFSMLALIAVAFMASLADVTMPRRSGFMLLMMIVIVCNVVWWTYADRALVDWPMRAGLRASLRMAVAAGVLAMCVWPVDMLLTGRVVQLVRPPTWAVAAFQLWIMVLVVGVPVTLLIAFVVRWVAWGVRGVVRLGRAARDGAKDDAATVAVDYAPAAPQQLTRRQLLATAGIYAPVVLVGAATAYGGRQNGRFEVNRYDLPAPWLPHRLRGLTITHISDLHVGRFYRPEHLPRLVEAANNLRSDLILMTGDLLDSSNDMIPPLLTALRGLNARHGMYLCVGNHDLIDDGPSYIRAVRDAQFDLLIDERRRVQIGGESITIAGLDWARQDGSTTGRPGHVAHATETLAGHDESVDGPCIALAHHPHAFDALAPRGAHLTLSGHTHGGQLMLTPPPKSVRPAARCDIGAGPLLFRYVRGFYERDGRTLFVNNGVGNWFPIRINAPAEIVQLRLV